MKKIFTICFFVVGTYTLKAQTKSPTKEQTIAFIQDYFSKGITAAYSEDSPNAMVSHEDTYSDFQFQIENTILKISYNHRYDYFYSSEKLNRQIKTFHNSKHQLVIDLRKIESISYTHREEPSGLAEPIAYTTSLKFKTAPGGSIDDYKTEGEKNAPVDLIKLPDTPKKEKETELVVNFFQAEANYDITKEGNNIKIFKAFNHLRKLCGAPEPISFD